MVLSTYSVRGSLTAADITALRFGVAGLAFLPYALRKGLKVGPWPALPMRSTASRP